MDTSPDLGRAAQGLHQLETTQCQKTVDETGSTFPAHLYPAPFSNSNLFALSNALHSGSFQAES